MRDSIIKNIGRLVTMVPGDGREGRLGVTTHAAICIEGGLITWFGPERALPPSKKGRVVNAAGGVVLPGLIDCHTHLIHAGWRHDEFNRRSQGETYQEIATTGGGIMSTVCKTREASGEELYKGASGRLDESLRHGVTTLEVKTGYGLDVDAELKMVNVIGRLMNTRPGGVVGTFLGAHVVPSEYRDRRDEYIQLLTGEMLPAVAGLGAISACDVFVEEGAFTPEDARAIARRVRELGLDLHLHVDQFGDGAGAALAAELGAKGASHLGYANESGLLSMLKAGVTAVVLPGASFFAGRGHYPNARKMCDIGLPVAIATDYNPGTSPSLDILLSATIAVTQMGLTCDEALLGITRHGATALGLSDRGAICVGNRADMVIFDAPDEYFLLYRYGACKARTVVIAGEEREI